MSRRADRPPIGAWLRDGQPFDLLSAAIAGIYALYDTEAQRPIAPLRDEEPAPRFAAIEHP